MLSDFAGLHSNTSIALVRRRAQVQAWGMLFPEKVARVCCWSLSVVISDMRVEKVWRLELELGHFHFGYAMNGRQSLLIGPALDLFGYAIAATRNARIQLLFL